PAERQKVVFEAQQYIYDQVPVIALVYPNTIQAFRNDRVTDLTPIPSPNGYITPNYSSLPFLDAQPASTTSGGGSSSGSDTGLPVWIWAVVALVVVGAVAVYYVRRRGAEDTEEG
ncbi:MAG: ABC transporter substrate-binding protein, partial [Actinomycetota bacterium]|nr:ABC transporter substrate-binding protein [Actinomycetota bacterium]